MKVGQTSDMINMMHQMFELESLIKPDMAVYNSIIETGFSALLFNRHPCFLSQITIIEEFIALTINGLEATEVTDFSRLR